MEDPLKLLTNESEASRQGSAMSIDMFVLQKFGE